MNFHERLSKDVVLVAIIVAIALVVRIVSFSYLYVVAESNSAASPYPVVAGDSTHYVTFATSLLERGTYEESPGVPHRGWPVGYPLLLAAAKLLTGSMIPLILLQLVLTCVAIALMYRMALALVPRTFALLPPFVYALDPMVAFVDSTLLTDGLFSALMVCMIYLLFFARRPRPLTRYALSGAILGMAILLRPIAQFLILVIPVVVVFHAWYNRALSASHGWRVATFVVLCAVFVTPWMMRNQLVFGSFEVSNLGGYNLLTNHVRGFLAWRAFSESDTPVPAILAMRRADNPIYTEVTERIESDLSLRTPDGEDRLSYMGGLALSYIFADPVRYAYFHSVNTTPFFLSSSIASYGQIVRQLGKNEGFFAPVMVALVETWQQMRDPESVGALFVAVRSVALVVLEIGAWALATLLALWGLYTRRREFPVLLCALLVAYFAALTGPMSNSRYRIPAEPYLLILTAVGLHVLARRGQAPPRHEVERI